MLSSVPIPPFARPAAPPPPVVVLLDATDLYIEPASSILVFEDLHPGISLDVFPNHPTAPSARYHPYNRQRAGCTPPPARRSIHLPALREVTPHLASCRNTPAPAHRADTSPLSSPTPSPRSSLPLSTSEHRHISFAPVLTKIKIERPKGAGRKNLQSQVKWESMFLNNVKVRFHMLVFC